jgi:hypothetical protein
VAAITRNAAERETALMDHLQNSSTLSTHKFLPAMHEMRARPYNEFGHVTRKVYIWLFIIIKYMSELVVFGLSVLLLRRTRASLYNFNITLSHEKHS